MQSHGWHNITVGEIADSAHLAFHEAPADRSGLAVTLRRLYLLEPKYRTAGPQSVTLFWEQERKLESDRIIRSSTRLFHVVIGFKFCVDRLISDLENPADTSADRHRPAVAAIGFPVGSHHHIRQQVPPLAQVVVDEGFDQCLVDILPVIIAGKRPQLATKYPYAPPFWLSATPEMPALHFPLPS